MPMQLAATSPPELVQQLNTYKGNAKMTIDALTTGGLNMLQVGLAWFAGWVGVGWWACWPPCAGGGQALAAHDSSRSHDPSAPCSNHLQYVPVMGLDGNPSMMAFLGGMQGMPMGLPSVSVAGRRHVALLSAWPWCSAAVMSDHSFGCGVRQAFLPCRYAWPLAALADTCTACLPLP